MTALLVDIHRPAPHIIWGEAEPYNAICPECDARYMRRGPADGFIDVVCCHECEAQRELKREKDKVERMLRKLPRMRRTDERRRHLEERLLAMGGKLPRRRVQEVP